MHYRYGDRKYLKYVSQAYTLGATYKCMPRSGGKEGGGREGRGRGRREGGSRTCIFTDDSDLRTCWEAKSDGLLSSQPSDPV